MKTLSALLLLTAVLLAPAFAQEAEKTPAMRLYELTSVEDTSLDAAMAAFLPALQQMENQGVPAGAVVEIKGAAMDFFSSVFTGDAYRQGVQEIYNDAYTASELEELIAFYQSPLGQKTLNTMPQVLSQSMALGQRLAGEKAPAFEKRLGEIIERHKKAEDE